MKSYWLYLFLSLSQVFTYAQATYTFCVPNGFSAYHSFENTNRDRSGLGHHALNPVSSQPDLVLTDQKVGNYSVSFDGSTQFLHLNDEEYLNTEFSQASVMLWFNTQQDTGIQTLFDEGATINAFSIQLQGQELQAIIRINSTEWILSHQLAIDTGQWHHVALQFDAGNASLYLDGVKAMDPDTAVGISVIPFHSGYGGIGANILGDFLSGPPPVQTNQYFKGLMDDFAYYRGQVFTQAEIQNVMNCQELPFPCDNTIYMAQNAPTDLYAVNNATAPYSFIPIKEDGTFQYNAMGFSEMDDFMYALVVEPISSSNLVRISAGGHLTDLGPIDGVDPISVRNAGDISADGMFYFNQAGIVDHLMKLDLMSLPYQAQQITFASDFQIADLAINPTDGLIYAVDELTFQVLSFNPDNGTMLSFVPVPGFNGAALIGSAWFNLLGEMFVYQNTGTIYQVDLTNQTTSFVSAAPNVSKNDGATCTEVIPTVDIALSLDSMNIPSGGTSPGDSLFYAVHISNLGTSLATNIQIRDQLPEGLIVLDTQLVANNGLPLDTSLFQLEILGSGANRQMRLDLDNLSPGQPNSLLLNLRFRVGNKGIKDAETCMYVDSVMQEDTNPLNDTLCLILQEIANNLDQAFLAQWEVFPNPALSRIHIKSRVWNGKLTMGAFINPLGQVLLRTLIDQQSIEVDVSSLPTGWYYLQLRQEGQTATFPIYKQE